MKKIDYKQLIFDFRYDLMENIPKFNIYITIPQKNRGESWYYGRGLRRDYNENKYSIVKFIRIFRENMVFHITEGCDSGFYVDPEILWKHMIKCCKIIGSFEQYFDNPYIIEDTAQINLKHHLDGIDPKILEFIEPFGKYVRCDSEDKKSKTIKNIALSFYFETIERLYIKTIHKVGLYMEHFEKQWIDVEK